MKEIIHAYYMPGLRESQNTDIHPKLKYCIDWINDKYTQLNLPYEITTHDLESYLLDLETSRLEEITGTTGSRNDIVRKILTPLTFEEARDAAGIQNIDGKWYQDNTELKDIDQSRYEFDGYNFNILRKVDIKSSILKKYSSQYKNEKRLSKVLANLNGTNRIFPTKDEFISAKMADDYQSILKKYVNLLGYQYSTTESAEKIINDKYTELYKTGNHQTIKMLELDKILPIDKIDLAIMYINTIQEIPRRQYEYTKMSKTLDMIKSKGRSFHPTQPFLGYENKMGNYPLNKIYDSLPAGQINYILIDRFHEGFHIPEELTRIYDFFRPLNGNARHSTINDIENKNPEWIKFLLLHEFAHLATNALDIKGFDTQDNQQMMLAPIYYKDLNGRKMSDEAIIEAYDKKRNRNLSN